MAKFGLLLFAVALLVSIHANEAHRKGEFDAALEKDLHKAETMIQKDLQAKKKSNQVLASEVKSLSKSEQMLNNLGKDHKKKNMLSKKDLKKKLDLIANAQKLKKFSRVTKIKKAPARKRKSVSIIQSILKDFGLNGGRN